MKALIDAKNLITHNSIFVIANGGSIKLENQKLNKIECDTIACNGFYPHGKNMFGIDPTYYFVGDGRRLERDWDEWDVVNNAKNTTCLFSFAGNFKMDLKNACSKMNNVIYINSHGDKSDPWNIDKGIFRKFDGRPTSTNIMVQIAFWFGYKNIYVVGHDLQQHYTGYFWQLKRIKFGKPKSDRPKYKVDNQILTWKVFKKRADEIGTRIFMCSAPKYNLLTAKNIFEYIPFEEAIKNSK